MDRSRKIHTQHPDRSPKLKVGRLVGFLRLCLFQCDLGRGLRHSLPELFPLLFHFRGRNIFLPEFAEIPHSLIRIIFGALQDPLCLFVGIPNDPFLLGVEFFLLFLCAASQRFQFFFVGPDFCLLPLNGTSAVFQIT